jgi:hypothetical protein
MVSWEARCQNIPAGLGQGFIIRVTREVTHQCLRDPPSGGPQKFNTEFAAASPETRRDSAGELARRRTIVVGKEEFRFVWKYLAISGGD